MNQRNRFGVLLLIILLVAVGYYFATTRRDKGLVLVGTVDAKQVIVSAKIQGRIENLPVDEGTVVKQGDLIAQLDTAELEAQKRAAEATIRSLQSQVSGTRATEQMTKGSTTSDVQNAQAQLNAARASLHEAQANLGQTEADSKRTVSLADQGIASQQDKDRAQFTLAAARARVQSLQDQVHSAQAALEAAQARTHNTRAAESTVASTRAQMNSAQAQLAEIEARLSYTRVVAPVSGVVTVRAALQGEVVNPGEPIVTIVDLSETWVRAAIPETQEARVKVGDTLQVRMPGGETVPGKVLFKSTEGDYATQRDVSRMKRDIKTVGLKLRIDNQAMKYVIGMTAEVLVPPGGAKQSTTVAGEPR